MTKLNKKFNNKINEIISESELSENESKDLAKELACHFFEKNRDIELNSQTNDKSTTHNDLIEKSLNDFGDTKTIGKFLFYSHHPYLEIPVIGPLVYFKETRYAMIYFAIYLLSALFAFALILLSNSIIISTSIAINISKVIALLPYVMAGITGYLTSKKALNLKQHIIAALISLLPVVLFFISNFITVFVSNPEVLIENFWTLNITGYMILNQIIWLTVATVTFLVTFLVKFFTKKYTKKII
ncbi:hypothetical protein JW887_04645 [Candidatus Dojkabacteria bacterium]|nr:hypothetical protein [Candidatus Dojkabacteria bacterium]